MNKKITDMQPMFLKSSERGTSGKTRIKTEKKFGLETRGAIYCASCGNIVTGTDSIIAVDGSHVHEFTNPAGVTYEIGCFSYAEGCLIYGEPSEEHTWFRGFAWSYAVCSGCSIHLGWFYESGDENFFGLIMERLSGESPNGDNGPLM